MPKEFTLPDLGEGITEAQIVRVLISDGDAVAEDQYLMEVETDKAAVEIPSPYSGIATKVHVHAGQTINVGDVIVTFSENGTSKGKSGGESKARAAAEAIPAPAEKTAPRATAAPPAQGPRKSQAAAAPAVRKLARDMKVNIDHLEGTGPGGRVTKEDVQRQAHGPEHAGTAPSAPRPRLLPTAPLPGIPDVDKWGAVRREPLSQIRKTIAKKMAYSASTIPHVTHSDEADITELDDMRRRLNEATGNDPKLTVMSFILRATCLALRKFPIFNASFDEESSQIIYKDYVNIGIAVDTERGLIVPVIRNSDQLSIRGIASELRSLADRIRSKQFGIEDLRGGSFTVTNVGALGGLFTTPIINHPEVAILSLGRSRKVPVIRNGEVQEALTLLLSLSFDHRAADGAAAARFIRELISYLETPAKFLLD